MSDPTTGLKPRMGGLGSAWKAGALNQTQEDLNERRAKVANDILHGRHELELHADQIKDDFKHAQGFSSIRLSSTAQENIGRI